MKRVYLYFFLLGSVIPGACHNDESYKQAQPTEPATIDLLLTGRVGSVVGDSLVEYVDALTLLLFRENTTGDYVLFRQKMLNKEQLRALTNGDGTESGFTLFKEILFDTVPAANYRIVGVGNVLDSAGNQLPQVSLEGTAIGTSMAAIPGCCPEWRSVSAAVPGDYRNDSGRSSHYGITGVASLS